MTFVLVAEYAAKCCEGGEVNGYCVTLCRSLSEEMQALCCAITAQMTRFTFSFVGLAGF